MRNGHKRGWCCYLHKRIKWEHRIQRTYFTTIRVDYSHCEFRDVETAVTKYRRSTEDESGKKYVPYEVLKVTKMLVLRVVKKRRVLNKDGTPKIDKDNQIVYKTYIEEVIIDPKDVRAMGYGIKKVFVPAPHNRLEIPSS